MRVLHVIPSIAPRYGGPGLAIIPMVRALNNLQSIQADIATTDSDGMNSLDSSMLPGDIDIHLFHRTCSERWKLSIEFWSWIKSFVSKYDLLHIHAIWSFTTVAACFYARKHGIPYILRPCGMLSDYTWSRSSILKRIYWTFFENTNIKHAHAFHVTSSEEAQEVRRYSNCKVDSIYTIPLGIDTNALSIPVMPDYLRSCCGTSVNNRPIILFLSRLHPKKGIIDYLLPAFKAIRSQAFLAIVGDADTRYPHYSQLVTDHIQRLELQSDVALVGSIVPTKRWHIYDGASIFVLPSHSENYGIVVIEAMSRGIPVVVSDQVQSCEHVRLGNAGRIVPLVISALSSAMSELIQNSSSRTQLGTNGRLYTQAHLTWSTIASQIATMYHKCLRSNV